VSAVVHRKAPGSPSIDARVVRTRADRMLRAVSREDAELSVLLTNDPTIHDLNARFRGKDRPTDVLAFPMEGDDGPTAPGGPELLGDVVVSIDTAARQALKRRRPLLDEITHLLAHGLLHLVGYDHRTDAEERVMDAETQRLVSAAVATKPLKRS
jgi:probable rRNA maturation factor